MSIGQRSYFRIDVMMRCSYRLIKAEDIETNPIPEKSGSRFIENYMMQDLMDLDKQINDAIVKINERSALLASALEAINGKLNFLMETVDPNQIVKAIPYRPVNLSGNGIAIDMTEELDLHDKVDLLMQPLENEDPILVRASIVNIQPREGNSMQRVALTYDNLTEDDRRKLIFFIQAKEIEVSQKERFKEKDSSSQ